MLLLDESTIRRYRKWYEEDSVDRLLNDNWGGGECRLREEQEHQLIEYLEAHLLQTTTESSEYVFEQFGVEYNVRGMQHALSRLGLVYKKAKAVPRKADAKKQREFVKQYKKLKSEKNKKDPIYFIDGTHPLHNSQPSYGWRLRGKEKQIPSNTVQK